jgi:hypothetical protein
VGVTYIGYRSKHLSEMATPAWDARVPEGTAMDMDSVFTVAFEAVRDVSWNGLRERKAKH